MIHLIILENSLEYLCGENGNFFFSPAVDVFAAGLSRFCFPITLHI